jgi:Zn-dependent peptidase ImmA (M78 family)
MQGIYVVDPAVGSPIIGLSKTLEANERKLRCVLAHELGHHFRTAGKWITAACQMDKLLIAKIDRKADDWALDTLIPSKLFVTKLIRGMSIADLADPFFVTEGFARKKLEQLKRRGFRRVINTDRGSFIFYDI